MVFERTRGERYPKATVLSPDFLHHLNESFFTIVGDEYLHTRYANISVHAIQPARVSEGESSVVTLRLNDRETLPRKFILPRKYPYAIVDPGTQLRIAVSFPKFLDASWSDWNAQNHRTRETVVPFVRYRNGAGRIVPFAKSKVDPGGFTVLELPYTAEIQHTPQSHTSEVWIGSRQEVPKPSYFGLLDVSKQQYVRRTPESCPLEFGDGIPVYGKSQYAEIIEIVLANCTETEANPDSTNSFTRLTVGDFVPLEKFQVMLVSSEGQDLLPTGNAD